MTQLRLVAACAAIAATLTIGGASSSQMRTGYLTPGEFDVTAALEPAPRRGDPRFDTDRKIFRATRKLEGTPRWQLATNDAKLTVPALLDDFSCAVGMRLTPENAPKLVALVTKAAIDTGGQTARAKEMFQRNRPFLFDRGNICQPKSELFDKRHDRMSYDYPSGHTTWGWTWALILTAAVPDRAQQILARGRAYGDSRFVCGAHNESAVEAGMQSAGATMAVISAKAAYQADLAGVRDELAALRASGEPPARDCAAESALIAERVMPKLDNTRR